MMRNDILFDDAFRVLEGVDFSPLDGATIFLTGSTGLLGTHFLATLCLLKERGMNITVFAEHHSAPAEYTKEIAQRGDIPLVQKFPKYKGADVIIHAAGYAQPSRFTLNPAATIELNTTKTNTLLNTLQPGGKFLFVSSSEVYSGLQQASETNIGTTTPYHPRACYIEGKRCGEAICDAYRQSGVHAVSARLSLTYGPGTRKHDLRAMSGFIEQALTQDIITMKYAGKESRTYCYIQDAMKMLWRVALHGTQPVYNVGGGPFVRTRDMVAIISTLTGVEFVAPSYFDMIGAPDTLRLDTSRIENEFGKTNYTSLEEGLQRTIDWQRELYGATVQ